MGWLGSWYGKIRGENPYFGVKNCIKIIVWPFNWRGRVNLNRLIGNLLGVGAFFEEIEEDSPWPKSKMAIWTQMVDVWFGYWDRHNGRCDVYESERGSDGVPGRRCRQQQTERRGPTKKSLLHTWNFAFSPARMGPIWIGKVPVGSGQGRVTSEFLLFVN